MFISIHTNSIASRTAQVSGTETYTLGLHQTQENLEVAKKENSVILIEDDYTQQYAGFNPNSSESYIIFEFLQDKNMAQSVNFAQLVQKQFRAENRTDKGVHQAGFLVLRETTMPSVLIELGYITNPAEERFLLSDAGSSTLARSIYKAFLNYKQGKGKDVSVPQPQQADRQVETEQPVVTEEATTSRPVFKIQILTASKVLPKGSRQLKGLSPVDYYREGGLVKYTYGAETDYNKILRLKRNKVDSKFSDAFIIAFRGEQKMDVNQAIKEFKNNRK